MITGDHARTAQAIARQVGIAEADVFARVTAVEKLDIVRSLQGQGHVVAMTGDGVNDAPALKQADIGLAMGMGGTEVAKEAADMVILDDDFATIESAVEEGRTVFDNLVKFIVWTLPTNFSEGLIVLVAVGLNTALPVLPLQILWINTVTAVALGVMLAFEPAEPDIMRRPPRPPGTPLLSRGLIRRIVIVGAAMLLGTFAAFIAALQLGLAIDEARTIAVNALVAMEIAYLLTCRSLRGSLRSVGLFSNPWIWVGIGATTLLQLVLTYVPVMNAVFSTAPMGWIGWALVLFPGPLVYLLATSMKWAPARAAVGGS
jgi:magnesium-transporting ATPase (P-type)